MAKWEIMFVRVAFLILFLGCVGVLWQWYADLNFESGIAYKYKELKNGWHLPDMTDKGYVAELRYKEAK